MVCGAILNKNDSITHQYAAIVTFFSIIFFLLSVFVFFEFVVSPTYDYATFSLYGSDVYILL